MKNKTIALALVSALLLTNIGVAEASINVSNEDMVSLRGINRNPYRPNTRSSLNAPKAVPTPINNLHSSELRNSLNQNNHLRRLMRRPLRRSARIGSVSLLTDGVMVYDNLPIEYSNGEIMLPMDLVSDVLGASYTWDETTRQFSMSYKEKFLKFTEGSSAFLTGDYIFDEVGSVDKIGRSTLTLDAMPLVHNDRFYAPFNEIAKELGILYSYSPENKTVTITSILPTSTIPPVVKPPESRAFRTISGKRLQQLYDTGTSFVALLYNSNDPGSDDTVDMVKTAAETAGYRVYGVDMNAPDSELSLIGVTEGRTFPAMIFCYSKDDVSYLEGITGGDELSKMIANVKNKAFYLERPAGSHLLGEATSPATTSEPSPSPNAPEATPVPIDQSSGNWNVVQLGYAEFKFREGEKFIFVCYDSSVTPLDDPSLLLIKEAADNSNVPVYVTDMRYNKNYWFGWDYTGYYSTPSPAVYFVRATNYVTPEIRPTDVNLLTETMRTFY